MADTTGRQFNIIETADFYDPSGKAKFSQTSATWFAGHEHIQLSRFAEHRTEITPDQWANQHAAIVLAPRVSAASIANCDNLLSVARFGVGYDSVDVAACTERDILVMIAAGAVDRSVAEATVGWMMALTHHTLVKDRLVRTGDWDARTRYMGRELRGRTLGVIGFGGIGRALVALLQGFGMAPPLAFDPFVSSEDFSRHGVQSVGLDELLSAADFVSIHCPLNAQTRGLIGPSELRSMKKEAYLINTARGGIVDEDALYDVLQRGDIAGAALDCFADEPVTVPSRFRDLDNVILAPHSIAWTDEMFRDIGMTICRNLLDLSLGRRPAGVVNRQLLERDSFRRKWGHLIGRAESELE